MSYIGDFNTGVTIYSRFTTVGVTGAPTTLAGTPALSVYKTNSTTQTTTGVSLGVDHDSVTGLHLFTVDTSADGTFYAAGCDFQVVITTGTVGGTSVVGYVIAEFSIENRNIKANVTQFGGSNGTFSSGRPETNTSHIAGSAVSTSTAQIGVNIVNFGGSAGTFSSGRPEVNTSHWGGTAVASAVVSANAIQISGDSTAADNAESFFDGTGYAGTNNVIPTVTTVTNRVTANTDQVNGTTQTAGDIIAAIAGIGTAGGAAVNVDATTDNASGGISGVTSGTTKVGTQTGTYASTSFDDGSYHVITHATNAIDWVYQFSISGGTTPVGIVWTGYLDGSNDSINVSAWNHVGGAWEAVGTIAGQPGTTDITRNFVLYARHSGTSVAELGKVYVRFHCTGQTSPVLHTDQLYVSYSVTSRTVGYALGAVWIDTQDGAAGTASFVNGTADNTVLTFADAQTIASALNIHNFQIINGSTITLSSSTTGKVFNGHEWYLELGGQDVSNCMFIDASVSGTGTGTAAEFEDCEIGTTTIGPCQMYRCGFGSTLTLGATGNYLFVDCFSSTGAAVSPVLDLGSGLGATNVKIRRWAGGLTLSNVKTGDFVSINAVSGGNITIDNTCTGGTVLITGIISVTDNSGGAVTVSKANAVGNASINAEMDTALGDYGALKPTTAGRTLDVTATGAAGVDWSNVENPTTTLNLSGTTISTSQAVASVSGAVGSVTGAVGSVTGNVGGNVAGSVGSVTGNVGGNVTGSIGSLATQAKADVNAEADTALSDYGALKPTTSGRTLDVTATGAAGIDWGNVENPTTTLDLSSTTISTSQAVASVSGAVGSVTGAVGSVTGNVGGNVVGSVASVTNRVTANTDQIGGSAQSLTDLKDFADTGYDPATHKVQGVVLVDTTTTNTDMRGTDNAALAATALSTAVWTSTRAGYLDNLSAGAVAQAATALSTATWTNTRAGYIDNLSGGAAALEATAQLILADTGTDGVVLSSSTMQSIATALLDLSNGVETSFTLRQALRLILSSAAGELAGAASSSITIRDINDTKARITATVDADGNRTALTYDAT